MALAGVQYHVGRESNATYGESLNGVQVQNAEFHQFASNVDPYIVPGDPSSGLLPGIHSNGPRQTRCGRQAHSSVLLPHVHDRRS